MRLWLLRHAQVDLPAGLCYGVTDAPALPDATEAAARELAGVLPHRPEVLQVSALQRTHQLARALRRQRPDLPAALADARLNEMDFGCWELQPWDAIPRPAFDAWMTDFAHHRFGGRESTQGVIDRVAAALAELRAQNVADAVWITHAGVIRAACFLHAHGQRVVADAGEWPREAPDPGGWTVLHW